MQFKGCHRCSGDLWTEVDIGSRLEDLVCLQCGHRQAAQASGPVPSIEELTSRRRPAPDRRPRITASTAGPRTAQEKTAAARGAADGDENARTLGTTRYILATGECLPAYQEERRDGSGMVTGGFIQDDQQLTTAPTAVAG